MAPYLPFETHKPVTASIATAHEPLKTAGLVKRSGCDGFTGSCVIYGQGGDVITTVTVYAPGQVTTVQGVPQTVRQITTQTVHQTATQTVSGRTQTTTVIQGSSTRKQTYCVVTVAGSEIRDLECHSGPSAPKKPYPHPTNYKNDEWDPGWVIGLGVGLALLLIGLLFFIYSRRKKSYRERSRPQAAPSVTHPPPMAAAAPSEPVVAGPPHPPAVAASHHPEPRALDPAHLPAHPIHPHPHPVPGPHHFALHPPPSRRGGHPAEVRVDRNGIRVNGYPHGAVVINNNRLYGRHNEGHQAANGRAHDPTPPVFPSHPPSPDFHGRFDNPYQPHGRATPRMHDLHTRLEALGGYHATDGSVTPAATHRTV